jgi:hypothetical protein
MKNDVFGRTRDIARKEKKQDRGKVLRVEDGESGRLNARETGSNKGVERWKGSQN